MADTRETIKFQPDLKDLRGLLKALNTMDKDSQTVLKDKVQAISAWTAQGIIASSYSAPYPAQTAVVAATVRYSRDRIPTVTIGGAKGRASGGANAGVLLFGNEFGGDRNALGNKTAFKNGGYRFAPRTGREGRGNTGYWIFPALKAMQPMVTSRWKAAVEDVLNNWTKGQ